jgi:hypothetical protein
MQVFDSLWKSLLISSVVHSVSCSRSVDPTSRAPAPPVPETSALSDFEESDVATVPRGFTAGLTGGGAGVDWQVRQATGAASGAKVVAQVSDDSTSSRFPHLVLDRFEARDVDLSVSFRTISGQVDRAAGLVFRYRDSSNYYVVRANALEGNVVAYKTEAGKRSNIGVKGEGSAYGVKVPVPHHTWSTLRVIAKGPLFEIFVDGRKLFEVEDDTFQAPGKVGLWTKADSVTEFDDLRVQSLD